MQRNILQELKYKKRHVNSISHALVITIFVQAVVLTIFPSCLKQLFARALATDCSNTKFVHSER